MVLANIQEATVGELIKLTNLHPSEIDAFGMLIRSKRMGQYKGRGIRLTDERLLNLMRSLQLKASKTAPEAPQSTPEPQAAPAAPEAPKVPQNANKDVLEGNLGSVVGAYPPNPPKTIEKVPQKAKKAVAV